MAPKLLHALYENDVLSEEAILEWYGVVTEEEEDEEESNEDRDYKRRVLQLAEKVRLKEWIYSKVTACCRLVRSLSGCVRLRRSRTASDRACLRMKVP